MTLVHAPLIRILRSFALSILAALFTVLHGIIVGWAVGLFFSEAILSFMDQLGITGLEMWQIGASVGFIGGFFRSVDSSK